MSLLSRPVLLVLVGALLAVAAPAGASELELVPEINAFIRLTEHTRLFLLADLTHARTEDTVDGGLGVHLDVTLMPILRRRLREGGDWERERYLWLRMGYQLAGDLDGRDDGFTEHRGVLDVNARGPLPFELWVASRARLELRDIDGEVSGRFRYRLGIEREFTAAGLVFVPYAQGEVFYDSRSGEWDRQLYQAGVEIQITRRWRVEPYYARQEDQRSRPAHLDRIGLVFKFYW